MSAVIYVRDVEKMTTFYSELLGTSEIVADESGEWTELCMGGAKLWIHLAGAGWRDERGEPAPFEIREMNPIKLIYSVPLEGEVDERVRELGGNVIDRPWGVDFCDPEGNVFSVQNETST